ncbi:MAG: DNA polymerase III subunit beta [Bacillota bacterium]
MRISTNSSFLYACLEIVEKALPVRTTIPLINNIFMQINKEELLFSTTNLEMTINTSMENNNDETGVVLLPSKIIEIMHYFPVSEVHIDINWDNYRIDISGGSAHFQLYGADPQDYPTTAFIKVEKNEGYCIEQRTLKQLIRAVVFAASSEETRPAFNGVLFTFSNDKIILTASDTYRLAIKEVSDHNWSFEEKYCLVPARVLRELMRLLDDGDGKVYFNMDDRSIAFSCGSLYFASRLLEEKYPDVSGVIPKEYETRIIIKRKELEDTISRAVLLAQGKNQAVNLITEGGNLEVKVTSQQGSMEEFIPVEQKGNDIDLFVNSRFMLDVLRVTNEESVIVDFHGKGGPIIFRAENDPGFLYLVLPIKKFN